jgi:hypothetical protein
MRKEKKEILMSPKEDKCPIWLNMLLLLTVYSALYIEADNNSNTA